MTTSDAKTGLAGPNPHAYRSHAGKVADLTAEWRDYPADDLPAIPPAFDFYWSAMYPMFTAPDFRLGLIVEFADPAKREDVDGKRFTVYRDGPEEGDTPTDLLDTDEWGAVLACLIGERFADRLRALLTPEEWAIMQATNRQGDPLACASHDFCDANVVMIDAFADIMGRSPMGSFETAPDASGRHVAVDPWEEAQCGADNVLWNAAWSYAKPRHLTGEA